MNLFAAIMVDENAPIGTQSWYSIIPLVQLSFPAGTVTDPSSTCKEFLQQIMSLEPATRARILNTDIPQVSEQVEEVKRSSHKTLLVGLMGMIVLATILITGGYVAMTSHAGGQVDQGVIDKLTSFILEILKMAIGVLAPTPGA